MFQEDRLLVEYHEHMGLFEARKKFFSVTTGYNIYILVVHLSLLDSRPGATEAGACIRAADDGDTWGKCLVAIQRVSV